MLFVLPIGTDNPLRRTPVVNYAFIVANCALFLLTMRYTAMARPTAESVQFMEHWALIPRHPALYQFVTYAFLHGGWLHLIGNMIFLYIFGNNVNERLGHLGFALLYLGGAIFSGVGHAFLNPASPVPTLGASGAVATVTGAYLVLFPKTYVHVFYWLIFIGTVNIPALYFILFKLIIYDNLLQLVPAWSKGGNVAYLAHLAGYFYGMLIPLALLGLKLMPRSPYDLWALLARWRRRRAYAQVVQRGYDPYGVGPSGRLRVKSRVTRADPQAEQIRQKRTEVVQAAHTSDMNKAVEAYLELKQLDPGQVLPEQPQLDIANKLMHMGRHRDAAQAYEAFIGHYQKYPFMDQVELMLGLLYSRYLDEHDQAKQYLASALERLGDPTQRQMCQDELERLG